MQGGGGGGGGKGGRIYRSLLYYGLTQHFI